LNPELSMYDWMLQGLLDGAAVFGGRRTDSDGEADAGGAGTAIDVLGAGSAVT
jgi:hypothetical protein